MGKGYLDQYQDTKALKNGTFRKSTRRISRNQKSAKVGLTDLQLSAYQFFQDKGFLPLYDALTPSSLLECLVSKHFLALFRIGSYFKIFVTPPQNNQLSNIMTPMRRLLSGLQEKHIIPLDISAEQIARENQNEVFRLLVSMFNYAVNGEGKSISARLEELSNWLISLGIFPPNGVSWFTSGRPLYLIEDPLRNGDLLRSLCIVMRPEVYEQKPPPASTPKEMVERVRQSLAMLSEDGLIDSSDVLLAESVVQGTTNAAEKILEKAMKAYETKQHIALSNIKII